MKKEEEGRNCRRFTCKGCSQCAQWQKSSTNAIAKPWKKTKTPASFINQVKNGTDSQSAKAMQDNASQINATRSKG